MKDLYLSRLSKQAEVAKDAMSEVSQALWRCDPREHVEDETYTKLTHFLQVRSLSLSLWSNSITN